MILSVGKTNVNWLIDDMIEMAADRNERHEENENTEFKHEDGWGISYLSDEKLNTFRSAGPIFDDPQIDQFRNLESRLLILHTRHASKGAVNIHNVHPFEAAFNNRPYVFFHNGTVSDKLSFDRRFKLKGTTDSEQYFYYLLSTDGKEINASLKKKLLSLKNFTGANFILSNGEKTFISNWWSINPNYYRMKMLAATDFTLFSSEILPHYKNEPWQKLENYDIFEIQTAANKVTKI